MWELSRGIKRRISLETMFGARVTIHGEVDLRALVETREAVAVEGGWIRSLTSSLIEGVVGSEALRWS